MNVADSGRQRENNVEDHCAPGIIEVTDVALKPLVERNAQCARRLRGSPPGPAEELDCCLRRSELAHLATRPPGGEPPPQPLGLGVGKCCFQRNDRRDPTCSTLQNDLLTLNCRVDELSELPPGLIDRYCSHAGTITHSGRAAKRQRRRGGVQFPSRDSKAWISHAEITIGDAQLAEHSAVDKRDHFAAAPPCAPEPRRRPADVFRFMPSATQVGAFKTTPR